MINIFKEGAFDNYRVESLAHSQQPVFESVYEMASQRTTVFISHKHDDLNDLKGIIGFLETNYNVKTYIDSRDSSMPKTTSGETALRIKDKIKQCDKFILLATNSAIESKWCNWELGYGDAQKFKDHIALFPMKPAEERDSLYKGNEYMQIYPYITYFDGSEKYRNGNLIKRGYYIRAIQPDGSGLIEPLADWFKK